MKFDTKSQWHSTTEENGVRSGEIDLQGPCVIFGFDWYTCQLDYDYHFMNMYICKTALPRIFGAACWVDRRWVMYRSISCGHGHLLKLPSCLQSLPEPSALGGVRAFLLCLQCHLGGKRKKTEQLYYFNKTLLILFNIFSMCIY